jgi:hypothetical protein
MGTQVSLAVQRRILSRRDVYFLDEYSLLSWNILKYFGSTTINLVDAVVGHCHSEEKLKWPIMMAM